MTSRRRYGKIYPSRIRGATTIDNRAIGVFDSGLGGLTAVRALRQAAPDEHVVYFGDTGRVPYGGRSPETILSYTNEALAFLDRFNVKAVIVACGTASAVALPQLKAWVGPPLFGVVEAAARRAVAVSKNKRVGVIGTAAAIGSDAYPRALRTFDDKCSFLSNPCPLLVPLVENGRIRPGDPVTQIVIREYMTPFKMIGIDTLILGCTHYPLLSNLITAELGANVTLVDAGREAALATLAWLRDQNALAGEKQSDKYYVSDNVPNFSVIASLFMGVNIDSQVELVRL